MTRSRLKELRVSTKPRREHRKRHVRCHDCRKLSFTEADALRMVERLRGSAYTARAVSVPCPKGSDVHHVRALG